MICPKCATINTFQILNANTEKLTILLTASNSTKFPRPKHQFSIFFFTSEKIPPIFWVDRAAVCIEMLYFGIGMILSPIEGNNAGQSFMHFIYLPFHEAGRIFLRPFCSFITSLSGSLFQLLVAVVCLFVMLVKPRDTFEASVAPWRSSQFFKIVIII